MTTPERLRRRQYIVEGLVSALLVSMGLSAIWIDARDDADDECFRNYIATTSETSALRSKLVAAESQSFREVIRDAGAATTRAQFEAALERAETAWRSIDREREQNPVRVFDPEVNCQ